MHLGEHKFSCCSRGNLRFVERGIFSETAAPHGDVNVSFCAYKQCSYECGWFVLDAWWKAESLQNTERPGLHVASSKERH